MHQAIGNSLALAVGVALSPVPVIAVILMLLSKRSAPNSLAFLAGWALAIGGVLAVTIAVASGVGTAAGGQPSHGSSTVKVVIGALLVLGGLRRWRTRPPAGRPAPLPGWMRALEEVGPVKSAGLGVLLGALNPKNLLLLVGGGLAVADAGASAAAEIGAAVVFGLVAVSSVAIPVILRLLLGRRAEATLGQISAWLEHNNTAAVSVVLVVVGAVLVGKGVTGL